jgi:phosphorylcholine metabolism protein LicD
VIIEENNKWEKILDVFATIYDRYYLRYYAAEGTLPKSVRRKEFMPWNDDVVISRPDYEWFIKISKDLSNPLYVVSFRKP